MVELCGERHNDVLLLVVLFLGGKSLNKEISQIQVKVDEQQEKIEDRKKVIAELKGRVSQGYKRLCELHPVNE